MIGKKLLRKHVRELVGANNIRVIRLRPGDYDWRAARTKRIVHIAEIHTVCDYWIALHEIGHVLCEQEYAESSDEVAEMAAWLWALKNSITKAGKSARSLMTHCLATYGVHLG